MDSSEDKNYALAFFNLILVLLLLALIICAAAFWFSSYERSFAIANTGASVGILLAALSARSAKSSVTEPSSCSDCSVQSAFRSGQWRQRDARHGGLAPGYPYRWISEALSILLAGNSDTRPTQ
ncbi:MAG TPA: hypothetical protein VGE28_13115 [Pseudomonas sp.]